MRKSASPRPSFDAPTRIPWDGADRYLWGDATAGYAADWVFVSSEKIHMLVFGLPEGTGFRHGLEERCPARDGARHGRSLGEQSVRAHHRDRGFRLPDVESEDAHRGRTLRDRLGRRPRSYDRRMLRRTVEDLVADVAPGALVATHATTRASRWPRLGPSCSVRPGAAPTRHSDLGASGGRADRGRLGSPSSRRQR